MAVLGLAAVGTDTLALFLNASGQIKPRGDGGASGSFHTNQLDRFFIKVKLFLFIFKSSVTSHPSEASLGILPYYCLISNNLLKAVLGTRYPVVVQVLFGMVPSASLEHIHPRIGQGVWAQTKSIFVREGTCKQSRLRYHMQHAMVHHWWHGQRRCIVP